MRSQYSKHQPLETSIETAEVVFSPSSGFVQAERFVEVDPPMTADGEATEPTHFKGQFLDCMEMNAKPETVAEYLIDHQDWFRRCALPMKAEPLGERGYAIAVGRFGSYGYVVEPKIGLELLPPDEGVYRIETIPVPGYTPKGYAVDFTASLELAEAVLDLPDPDTAQHQAAQNQTTQNPADSLSVSMTRVEWQLDLGVKIWFPKFIHVLPKALIHTTGQQLLRQIVRQFSRRLTRKVQEDFHRTLGLEMPKKTRRRFPWQ